MADVQFGWTDGSGTRRSSVARISDTGDVRKPLVILLHGLGGSRRHWTDPAASVGDNYNYSSPLPPDIVLQRNATKPAIGIWNFTPDQYKPVVSWQTRLSEAGFRTVNYTQDSPDGSLVNPALELAGLVQTLVATPDQVAAGLILLAHSRGGLLARKFIKDNFGNGALVGRISMVITLHSPHLGSQWANDVTDEGVASITRALTNIPQVTSELPGPLGTTLTQLISDAVRPLDRFILSSRTARLELRCDGPFLRELAEGERALPGVAYHTFGGTSVRLTRILRWDYTRDSAAPHFTPRPRFRHTVHAVEQRLLSPLCDSAPNVHPEVTPGAGDILVSDARARLPFATHHSHALNHAEALWDPALQAEVITLLQNQLWGGWAVLGSGLSRPPALFRDASSRLAVVSGTTDLRARRELADGDPIPGDTLPPGPGEAAGWSNWYRSNVYLPMTGPVAGAVADGHLRAFLLREPSYNPLADSGYYGGVGGMPMPTMQNAWQIERTDNPDMWSDWRDLGGTAFGTSDMIPNLPVMERTLTTGLVAVRNGRGFVELFAVGSDHKIWSCELRFGTSEPRWTQVPFAVADRPPRLTALWVDDSIELYFRGTNGDLACMRRTGYGSTWHPTEMPPVRVEMNLATIRETNGAVLLAGRNQQGHLVWARRRPIGWSPWTTHEAHLAGDPALAVEANGLVSAFARDTSQRVVVCTQNSIGGTFNTWRTLGGQITGDPAADRLANGRLIVVALDTEQKLRIRAQVSPGVF